MKTLRYLVVVAAVGLAVAATADRARANPLPYVPQGYDGTVSPTLGHALLKSHQGNRNGQLGQRIHQFFQNHQQPKLPVFQAAPWYNYWPYDGHFLTPAPISGPFYGPPMTGNFPVNPYFPGPAFPAQGMIPGGPPPLMNPPGK